MIVFPNAKINIGLHIVSRRPDSYHNLETIFFPVPLYDALELAEAGKTDISFSGITADCPAEDNLVLKAYNLLNEDFSLPPVQFHLHKVIPAGAGLGGGSSDAAFTLKMINDYFRLNLDNETLRKYALRIGSDCPFFINNIPALGKGKGEKLYPLNLDLSGYFIVILKPGLSVSTREAYKNVKPSKPSFNLENLVAVPVEFWKDFVVNDFERTIFPSHPEIEKWKKTLYNMGALYAGMSGSGSAVYGIFRDLPQDLNKKIPSGILLTF